MSEIAPFAVQDREVTHVIIEIFGGDNNLSPFILEDMQEMAAGNRGPFAVLALVDYADRGGVVVELSPRTGNHVLEDLGEINTGDPETLASLGFAIRMNNLKVAATGQAPAIVARALAVCGITGYRCDSPYAVGRHLRDAYGAALMISNDRILAANAAMLLVHKED